MFPHLYLLTGPKMGSRKTGSGCDLPSLAGRRAAQVGSVQWMGGDQNHPPCCPSLFPSCGCRANYRGMRARHFGYKMTVGLTHTNSLLSPLSQLPETLPKGRGLEWCVHRTTAQGRGSGNLAPFSRRPLRKRRWLGSIRASPRTARPLLQGSALAPD